VTTNGNPPRRAKRITTFKELPEYGVRYSYRQLYRLEAANKFPKRVPIGPGRIGWVTDEIIAHVDARIASRSTGLGELGSKKKNDD
jgi:prophage regulatory protein